jgi:hypothetical protein
MTVILEEEVKLPRGGGGGRGEPILQGLRVGGLESVLPRRCRRSTGT